GSLWQRSPDDGGSWRLQPMLRPWRLKASPRGTRNPTRTIWSGMFTDGFKCWATSPNLTSNLGLLFLSGATRHESPFPHRAQLPLPRRPAPEVVHEHDENNRWQRGRNRLSDGRESERDDPIQRGPAQESDDRGPIPSTAVPIVAAFLREQVVVVATRLHEEIIHEGESPERHDDCSEKVEEEDVREHEVRLEQREERERDGDDGRQEAE